MKVHFYFYMFSGRCIKINIVKSKLTTFNNNSNILGDSLIFFDNGTKWETLQF